MSIIKTASINLTSSVGNTYDNTRTTTAGNVAQRTISGTSIIAPPTVGWIDVFTDAAETPLASYLTPNGRLFILSTITGGLTRVVLYNFNTSTGAASYVGKVQISLPNTAATTHTIRGFKVDDSNSSAIDIFLATTGSVAINGGVFLAHKVPVSDFIPVAFGTLSLATGSDQKAVYFLQDPANIGVNQLNTAATGLILDSTNKIIYCHNGVSATHQYYLYDYSLIPNTPGQTFTITIAAPGVVTATAHGFNANDPVVLSTTGALPTGLTAGTAYFVRNPTANTFELSATSGGASITTTGTQSGTHTVYRAFGTTSSLFKWKTGNLPALTGTLIAANSEYGVTPQHTTNSGSYCAFLTTTSNLYLGKISELTNGATTWPSLVTSNILGTTNQIIAPSVVFAAWDDSMDRALYSTNVQKIVAKQVVNNLIQDIYGTNNNDYLEGVTSVGSSTITQFGLVTATDFQHKQGWDFFTGASTGQRGIFTKYSDADDRLGTNYIISKVIDLKVSSILASVTLSELNPQNCANASVYYRTSGFGSASGGWTALPASLVFPANTTASQIQIKITFNVNETGITNPTLPIEAYINYTPGVMSSEYWVGSVDNTTQNGASPARTAFRLISTYTSSVPTLYFRAYDDNGNLVASANTAANPTMFEYTTNNGTSWNSLGTIPNTALTTEVRYNWSTPPGVRVTCSIRES